MVHFFFKIPSCILQLESKSLNNDEQEVQRSLDQRYQSLLRELTIENCVELSSEEKEIQVYYDKFIKISDPESKLISEIKTVRENFYNFVKKVTSRVTESGKIFTPEIVKLTKSESSTLLAIQNRRLNVLSENYLISTRLQELLDLNSENSDSVMQSLRRLTKGKHEIPGYISWEKIEKTIRDSCPWFSSHRLFLFQGKEKKNATKTDNFIEILKNERLKNNNLSHHPFKYL